MMLQVLPTEARRARIGEGPGKMAAVMTDVIYLDCNATTPCDPLVVEAMLPYLTTTFANPTTSNHRPGRDAATALERSRATVDTLLGGAAASEVVFTALAGIVLMGDPAGFHFYLGAALIMASVVTLSRTASASPKADQRVLQGNQNRPSR